MAQVIEFNYGSGGALNKEVSVDSMGSDGTSGTQLRIRAKKCHCAVYGKGTEEEDERPLLFVELLLHTRYHTCITPALREMFKTMFVEGLNGSSIFIVRRNEISGR